MFIACNAGCYFNGMYVTKDKIYGGCSSAVVYLLLNLHNVIHEYDILLYLNI